MPEYKRDDKSQSKPSVPFDLGYPGDVSQKSFTFEENLDKFKTLASFVIWYP